MNTKDLAKLYDQLTARERLTSIIAASVRNDDVERTRLKDSAPTIAFTVPHHYGLAQALTTAAHYHLLTLLDLAATFWQWWGLWGWQSLRHQGNADQKRGRRRRGTTGTDAAEVRRYCLTRYHAFLFLVHVEGWKQFCSEIAIDSEAQLNFMPGWETITRTEGQARDQAFTREEAAMFLLNEAFDSRTDDTEEIEIPQILTAEGLAKDWHTFVDLAAESFGGEGQC